MLIAIDRINEDISERFRLAKLKHTVLTKGFKLRLIRIREVAALLSELSNAKNVISAILNTLSPREDISKEFLLYIVDSPIELIKATGAKKMLIPHKAGRQHNFKCYQDQEIHGRNKAA
jgi:hypothetical protein